MKPNIAIIIPVMNRVDFIERQLRYYHAVQCPHTIYIADGSVGVHAEQMKGMAAQWQKQLTIHLWQKPNATIDQSICQSLETANETYACVIGDDDFQIPDTLTACAEFLDTNNDYASAHGHAVTVRVERNAVFGSITKVKDYPQPQCEDANACVRIVDFFNHYYVSLFSVGRVTAMRHYWQHAGTITDIAFSCEIIPSALMLAQGKSKRIDKLGVVRQIHDRHKPVPNYFDWITQPDFSEAYQLFEKRIAEEIMKQEKCAYDDAKRSVREGFWKFLQTQLQSDFQRLFVTRERKVMKKDLIRALPGVMAMYRKIKPFIKPDRRLHAAVQRPGSKYYEDFRMVARAIAKSA